MFVVFGRIATVTMVYQANVVLQGAELK